MVWISQRGTRLIISLSYVLVFACSNELGGGQQVILQDRARRLHTSLKKIFGG